MFFFGARYGRAEVLAGFVNGLFLVFVAFFIFSEAVEVHSAVERYFIFCPNFPVEALIFIYSIIYINKVNS